MLRHALDANGVPARTMEDSLLLVTWNIREFDSEKYGERRAVSFYYIGEVGPRS